MEKLVIKVSFPEKSDAIRCHELFSWKLEKEEKLDVNKYVLEFSRDENLPHLNEIKKLEKDFFKLSKIPLWSLAILPVVIIVYLTVFMILFMTKTLDVEQMYKSIILSVPPAIFLLITMLMTFLRNKDIQKYILEHDERYKIYLEKVKEYQNAN